MDELHPKKIIRLKMKMIFILFIIVLKY